MAKYASGTEVSPEKSLSEIRATLKRYQASGFGLIETDTQIGIAFEMKRRRVRFIMPLPTRDEARLSTSNQFGSAGQYSEKKHEQLIRQRWRALALVIKAKLESVESGVEQFEEAFMAQLVLPDGRTVGEWAIPQIASAYETGNMPPLLPSGS